MNLQSCQCAKSFLSPLNGILCAVFPHAVSQAGFNDLWILNLMSACCWSAAIDRHRAEIPFWYRLIGSLLNCERHCRWRTKGTDIERAFSEMMLQVADHGYCWSATIDVAGELYQAWFATADGAVEAFNASGQEGLVAVPPEEAEAALAAEAAENGAETGAAENETAESGAAEAEGAAAGTDEADAAAAGGREGDAAGAQAVEAGAAGDGQPSAAAAGQAAAEAAAAEAGGRDASEALATEAEAVPDADSEPDTDIEQISEYEA